MKGKEWVTVNEHERFFIETDVMELPGGCLVRNRQESRVTALCWVPLATLDHFRGSVGWYRAGGERLPGSSMEGDE